MEAIVVSVRLLNHGRFLDNFVFSAVCLRDGEFFAKSVSDKRILSENLIFCKYQITLDAFYSIKKTLFRRGGGKNLAIKIVKGTVSCKLSTKIENLRCWSMYCICQNRTYIVSVQGCIIRSILPSGMGARGEHGDVFLFSNLGAL